MKIDQTSFTGKDPDNQEGVKNKMKVRKAPVIVLAVIVIIVVLGAASYSGYLSKLGGIGSSVSVIGGAEEGDSVEIHYTLATEGYLLESTEFGKPAAFVIGEDTLIPGFSKALIGMKPGDEKVATFPPEDAHGEYRQDLVQEINISTIKSSEGLVIGSIITAELSKVQAAREVIAVDEAKGTATIDFNSELAGRTLIAKIRLMSLAKK